MGERRTYQTDELRVFWDSDRCIHSEVCIRSLPAVFDPVRRPWIDLEQAPTEDVVATVERCPTGALAYERIGAQESPVAAEPVRLIPLPGGPLVVRGEVELRTPEGEVVTRESRLALCRCGNSRNQPFCDNSHRRVGFGLPEPAPDTADRDPDSPSEVCSPQPYGPDDYTVEEA